MYKVLTYTVHRTSFRPTPLEVKVPLLDRCLKLRSMSDFEHYDERGNDSALHTNVRGNAYTACMTQSELSHTPLHQVVLEVGEVPQS